MRFAEFLLKESVDKEHYEEIKQEIVDTLKKDKVSIRAVDFDSEPEAIVVYYNFGKQAPENYLDDKADIRKIILGKVKPLLIDAGFEISNVSNTANDQPDVGKMYFFKKVK
jgi:hypothetical protein